MYVLHIFYVKDLHIYIIHLSKNIKLLIQHINSNIPPTSLPYSSVDTKLSELLFQSPTHSLTHSLCNVEAYEISQNNHFLMLIWWTCLSLYIIA